MKRSLFVLLLALCPLAFLTFGSIVDFCLVPPRSVPDDSDLLKSVNMSSLRVSSRVRRWTGTLEGLRTTQLLIPASQKTVQALHASGFTGPAMEKFEAWNTCSNDVSEYLGVLWMFKSKDLPQLRQAMGEFDTLVARWKQDFKAGKLISVLEMQQSELQKRVEMAEKRTEAEALLVQARNAFDARHFTTARDKCNTLLTDYKDHLERGVYLNIVKLKARSEVYAGADVMAEIKLSSLSLEERLEKITDFLDTLEKLDEDEMTEEEKEQIVAFQNEARTLRLQIMDEQHSDAIHDAVENLKGHTSSVPKILAQAALATEAVRKFRQSLDKDDPGAHEKARQLASQQKKIQGFVTRVFRDKIDAEPVQADAGLQEAALTDGTLVRGFFKPVSDGGKVTGYRCYPTAQELAKPTVSVATTSVEDFRDLPGDAIEVRFAADYARERESLLDNLDSRGAWVDFQVKCQKMEDQLRERERQTGTSSKGSFRQPIAVAKYVLKDENWKKMESIFRK